MQTQLYTYVNRYNTQSKFTMESFLNESKITQGILDMDSDKRVRLLSKLAQIKYHSQSVVDGVNDSEKMVAQENIWHEIDDNANKLLPENISIDLLMAFIKNNPFFVQEKIPKNFQHILSKLNLGEDRLLVLSFPKNYRQKICAFLTDATGCGLYVAWADPNSEVLLNNQE